MCGICGYCSNKRISVSELEQMNDTMYHREPNDAGVWEDITDDRAVALAQRRLVILELSELGHQPMLSRMEMWRLRITGNLQLQGTA